MSAGTRRTVKGAGSGTPSKGASGGMTAGKKRMAAVTEKAVGLKDRLRVSPKASEEGAPYTTHPFLPHFPATPITLRHSPSLPCHSPSLPRHSPLPVAPRNSPSLLVTPCHSLSLPVTPRQSPYSSLPVTPRDYPVSFKMGAPNACDLQEPAADRIAPHHLISNPPVPRFPPPPSPHSPSRNCPREGNLNWFRGHFFHALPSALPSISPTPHPPFFSPHSLPLFPPPYGATCADSKRGRRCWSCGRTLAICRSMPPTLPPSPQPRPNPTPLPPTRPFPPPASEGGGVGAEAGRQAREEVLELRQDACDLQEYASAKLMRAQTYLQLLAKKAHGLDQVAQEAESKVAPLKKERRRLFNSLIQSKGNIRVVCRVRPAFEHEDSLALSFPDETTIRINPSAPATAGTGAAGAAGAGGAGSAGSPGSLGGGGGGGSSGLAKRDYELDHIYGPHVGQGDLFVDAVQPMVQAVMDGFNASIIAYGQSGSGKSHTMEGRSHDRGVFYRAFDEIYDLALSGLIPTRLLPPPPASLPPSCAITGGPISRSCGGGGGEMEGGCVGVLGEQVTLESTQKTYAAASSYSAHVSVLEMLNGQVCAGGRGGVGGWVRGESAGEMRERWRIGRGEVGGWVGGCRCAMRRIVKNILGLRGNRGGGRYSCALSDLVGNPLLAGHGSLGKVQLVHGGAGGGGGAAAGGGGAGGGVGGWGEVEVRGVREEAVSNPMEYAKVVKTALQHRAAGGGASGGGGLVGDSKERNKLSHLVVIVRVHHDDPVTGEQQDSKLLLADLASSERLLASSSASGDRLTASLHVQKSFSALGDCLSALTGKHPTVPYGNSKLTTLLSDCLGGEAKTVVVVTCSPSVRDVAESALSLAFAARSRNSELSLGTRDTIKKWRDMANDARREVFESERQTAEAQQEVLRLKDALRASEQTGCVLLTELQRAWAQAGLVEAQHHSEVERLMAEVAAGVEAQRRMEEEWETRAVLEGAKTVREHEEEMERMQQQHIAEIEAYKVQVEQLHGRLAEAAEMAATVAALRRPQEDSAEVAELRQRYEAAVQKMTAYKSELEKSEVLTRELNAENASLLSRLEATNSALAALENSALMKVDAHVQAQAQAQVQAHAQAQAQAQAGQGQAVTANGTAGHGDGGAGAGEGQGAQQQGHGTEGMQGGPTAPAAAAVVRVGAGGLQSQQQQGVGGGEWERRRDEVVGRMNRVMVDGQSDAAALAEESNACLREVRDGERCNNILAPTLAPFPPSPPNPSFPSKPLLRPLRFSPYVANQMLIAVAALPAGSEEEGRAAEEVRAAVVALLAWAHSKALSLDWLVVSCARLLLLRVLRSKSADVQSSKVSVGQGSSRLGKLGGLK
ncbi:unnamed protein product [Closterium sp. Naga37s-1]|nr:unnamed protein product [Closterium sp. Naga37s-1]